jgi:hypothetical protein
LGNIAKPLHKQTKNGGVFGKDEEKETSVCGMQ